MLGLGFSLELMAYNYDQRKSFLWQGRGLFSLVQGLGSPQVRYTDDVPGIHSGMFHSRGTRSCGFLGTVIQQRIACLKKVVCGLCAFVHQLL